MKMKVYIDANVFVSYKIPKEWDHKDAQNFIEYITKNKIKNVSYYTSEFALIEAVNTIIRKTKNEEMAESLLFEVNYMWHRKIRIIKSKNSQSSTIFMRNYKENKKFVKANTGDAIHIQEIIKNHINIVVTRNTKDFKKSKIGIKKLKVLTPDEALGVLSTRKGKKNSTSNGSGKLIYIFHTDMLKALPKNTLEFIDQSLLKADPNKYVYKINVKPNAFILIYSGIPKDKNLADYNRKNPIKVTLNPNYSEFGNKILPASNSEHVERTKEWCTNLHSVIEKLRNNPTGLFPKYLLKTLKLREEDSGEVKIESYIGLGNYKFGNRPVVGARFSIKGKVLPCNLILNKNLEKQILKKEAIKKIEDLKESGFVFKVPSRFRRKYGEYFRLLDKK